jgi:hypothetical protein
MRYKTGISTAVRRASSKLFAAAFGGISKPHVTPFPGVDSGFYGPNDKGHPSSILRAACCIAQVSQYGLVFFTSHRSSYPGSNGFSKLWPIRSRICRTRSTSASNAPGVSSFVGRGRKALTPGASRARGAQARRPVPPTGIPVHPRRPPVPIVLRLDFPTRAAQFTGKPRRTLSTAESLSGTVS